MLEDLRKQIDDLDSQIVRMIAERMRVAGEIGKEKNNRGQPIQDAAREKLVLESVKNTACKENISPEDLEKIYRQIVLACRNAQSTSVAFQGELGAYSEEASFQFFGTGIDFKPCDSLEDVFNAVAKDEVHFGVVPVENSLEGSISRTYDLLLESDLKVCGETALRVVHCLIGTAESRLETIKKVYSHPQALGQSQSFLRQMGYETVPAYDTAGSVKLIKQHGKPDEAAIASARAAEIYHMKILARGIEDNPHNYTRFFVLSRHDSPPSGNDKTSIVFAVKHQPGSLYGALKELAVRNINMTKIESRPTRQNPWEYNFYLDFDGHRQDQPAREALKGLEDVSLFVKVLGSYPKANTK